MAKKKAPPAEVTEGLRITPEDVPVPKEEKATSIDAAPPVPAVVAEVVEPVRRPEAAIATRQAAGALATQEAHPEVLQRLQDAREALETFDGMKLQTIKFNDQGFTITEGEDAVDEFEGIMVFTKESNVFYEKTYKPGQNLPPDCSSPDGRVPVCEKPKHTDCKTCPMNQFGSSKVGDGKACKNTRPTFFLVGSGVIPKVLRVPPTSLKNIRKYVLDVATNHGSYFAVRTKVSIYKESPDNTYNHIRFKVAGRVPAETVIDEDGFITALGRKDVRVIRDGWLPLMKEGNFGIDEAVVVNSEPQGDDVPPPPEAEPIPFDPENPQF